MDTIALTIPDAVRVSGIGRSKLYELFRTGALTPRKCGKRTIILVRELETFLNNLPTGGPSHGA